MPNFCNLIQGIYNYIHHDYRFGYQWWHGQLKMATTIYIYEREIGVGGVGVRIRSKAVMGAIR